jgi:hypothetical protein
MVGSIKSHATHAMSLPIPKNTNLDTLQAAVNYVSIATLA